jgi:hypothetical protein
MRRFECAPRGLVAAAFLSIAASCVGCGDAGSAFDGEDSAASDSALRRPPQLTALGTYSAEGGFDVGASEIVAYDARSRTLFAVNAAMARIDRIDISDPRAPVLLGSIDVTPWGAQANSVAVSSHGVLAAAIEAADKQAPGTVAFFDREGTPLAAVQVGALPDMLTFTPDERAVLVANEGEPNADYSVDPEGSVSIIDLSRGPHGVCQTDVRTADFRAIARESLEPSVRIFGPGASVAQDIEPEYIAVSHDSRTAWVTLQENNAIAVIDIRRARVERVVGLGFKDHSQVGSGFDASDKDGVSAIAPQPVFGMYMPDSIASISSFGRTYLIMANEGDAREYGTFVEAKRIAKLALDPLAFPNAAALQADAALGRLNATSFNGDTDGDGDFDELYAFGGRSFSIRDARGQLVFDSGDQLEQLTLAALPNGFNSNSTANGADARSDDKGPEPEGLTVGTVRGRTYAFIGLERVGGVVVYDVTLPKAPRFLQYLNTRDFAGVPADGTAGDLAPEGLLFIPASSSPTRKALLAVGYETSGTTTVFEFD